MRAIPEADSLRDDLRKQLDVSRHQCDTLLEELDEARREIDSLHATADPSWPSQRKQKIGAGASPTAEAADRASPAPPASGRLRVIFAALTTSEAALQACFAADPDPAFDIEHALEEELGEMREIRRRAAALAMHGMALMQRFHGALPKSMMMRVYTAAWRPTKAGAADASADAAVPAIARVYYGRRWLQVVLTVLWLIGATCFFTVVFDCFEAGSTQEWLASTATVLMLPIIAYIVASLNAKTVRILLTQFQTLYVVCSTITTLLVFGFKNICPSVYLPGSLVVLTSNVCCLFQDADTLAVMKAAYSLQGQTLAKRKVNGTVQRQLDKHQKSIMEAADGLMPPSPVGLAANAVAPGPAAEPAGRTWLRLPRVVVEELRLGADPGNFRLIPGPPILSQWERPALVKNKCTRGTGGPAQMI